MHLFIKTTQKVREINRFHGLLGQAKQIVCPRHWKTELDEIRIYNSMVMGVQEYYKIATAVNLDCRTLNRAVMTVLTSRLKTQTGNRLVKTERKLTKMEQERYGKSAMISHGDGNTVDSVFFSPRKNVAVKRLTVHRDPLDAFFNAIGIYGDLIIRSAITPDDRDIAKILRYAGINPKSIQRRIDTENVL